MDLLREKMRLLPMSGPQDSGGGGGGGQTQQSTQVSELPEWAKPYAQETLAKGQALTGQQYQNYGGNRIAGFSPLQQQAQQQAATMAPAEQLGTATSLAQAAGAGALGAGGYNPSQFYGGTFGTRQAAQYMNPYLEMSLAPQIAEAQRQAGIAGTQQAGQATQAGAFGGSRYGLQQAELQRNLGQNVANIVGQGYNNAFTQAQQQFNQDMARRMQAQQATEQSRQFGANLGLQGLQTGLQAAGTLGNLGQTQYGQQMGINQLQQQTGAQQQALEQQGLSQAYQDFLNQQNYPYKQLGFMSDLIRGLPLGQQSTAQVYQSPGSMLGQLGGIGMGLYGMSRMFPGAKDGGLMEADGYAEGGVTDDRNVEDILSQLSDAQLAQAKQAALNARDQNQLNMIESEMAQRASMRKGLGSIPVDFAAFMPDEQAMARGGIVAFADEGLVKQPEEATSTAGDIWRSITGGIKSGLEKTSKYAQLREQLREAQPGFFEALTPSERAARKQSAKDISTQMSELTGRTPEPKKETPPAQVEPTAKDREIMAKAEAEMAPPAPQVKAAPAKSISEAARIVTDVAKTQVPKDDVKALFEEIYGKSKEEKGPEAEALARMLQKAEQRAEDIKARSVGDALMKFGFGMAASAAKPGQARRAGLAGALESAAAAAPLLAESTAENEKLQAAAEDNALKLRLENARYQSAVEQNKKQLAASLAGSISQRNLQQASLEEQIAQNARANKLKEQEIAGLSAYRQASTQTSIQKIADDLQAADPRLDRKTALNEASRISGYSFRTDSAAGGKLAAALSKIEEDYKMLPALMAGNPNSQFTQNMAADRQRRIKEVYRLYGTEQPGGVTSGQSPAPGAGQMKIVGVR